ncbi:1,2-phenylacetyl-CoA epoxidase subunit PaaC [Promicromonospora sukumoe]|uniref:1,2-phenylacetyl-CoA epoxidase subunit PaaC n=1 Tax=Promicromonospora sukumoe TaxID=88382 RepID=UPI000376237E|nr:1,2-phenylacetyl-CoA epoxidase subunit PaaC [Promicromonospora sukumoe]
MPNPPQPSSAVLTPEAIAASVTGQDATVRAADDVARYALGLGDDALVLAQRLGSWIASAPELEEDVALGNIALDTLGHARSLLTYAGSAWDQTEDDLAYFRDEADFRCRQIFERPNGDFACTIVRQLVVSAYFTALYRGLAESTDATLAAIAAKAVKEVAYHLDHASLWTVRLALGTEESRRRTLTGLEAVWPFVDELFAADPAADAVPDAAVAPAGLREPFDALVLPVLARAELEVPAAPALRGGGRLGVHSEALGPLLAEMQVLARRHPGAVW